MAWPVEDRARLLSIPLYQASTHSSKKAKPSPVIDRTNIQIRASSIPGSGGGVFYAGTVEIKRGTLLGYYGGANVKEEDGQTHDYAIDGGRNPIDPEGRLRMNDGSIVDSNKWSSQDWNQNTNQRVFGVEWISGENREKYRNLVPANWTRFMNTATGIFLNVNMVTSGTQAAQKYNAYAFVSCQPIYPGDELFWSYGSNWLKSRGIAHKEPNATVARPNWSMWPYLYAEEEDHVTDQAIPIQ